MFKIFGSKPKQLKQDIDLGIIGVDIHSHLVPSVDDGSKDMETSLNLISQMKELGYRKMIITPHVISGSYNDDLEALSFSFEQLKQNVSDKIEIELALGAEHLLDESFTQRIANKKLVPFSDNYLLVELPFSSQPMGLEENLFELQLAGYNLVLAHPERYMFLKDRKKLVGLKDRGVMFQINMISLSGYYGKNAMSFAEYLIKENMVEMIGSDCHGQRHIDAIKRTLRSPLLAKLIDSGKLINNKL